MPDFSLSFSGMSTISLVTSLAKLRRGNERRSGAANGSAVFVIKMGILSLLNELSLPVYFVLDFFFFFFSPFFKKKGRGHKKNKKKTFGLLPTDARSLGVTLQDS